MAAEQEFDPRAAADAAGLELSSQGDGSSDGQPNTRRMQGGVYIEELPQTSGMPEASGTYVTASPLRLATPPEASSPPITTSEQVFGGPPGAPTGLGQGASGRGMAGMMGPAGMGRGGIYEGPQGGGGPSPWGLQADLTRQPAFAATLFGQPQYAQQQPQYAPQQIPMITDHHVWRHELELRRLVDEVASLRVDNDAIRASVTKLESKGDDRERKRMPMMDRKAYMQQPKYVGTPKEFSKWVFGFRGFLRQETGFEGYFDWIDKLLEPPEISDMPKAPVANSEVEWYDEQLYMLLVGLCSMDDNAITILRNTESHIGCRGALSWFKLSRDCKGKGRAREEELRELVVTDFPKSATYAEALKNLETWETNLREFEVLRGESMSDFDKVVTIKDMMPADIRRDVAALEKTGYGEVYAYVSRQIALRREEERRHSRKKTGGPLGALDGEHEGEQEVDPALSFQKAGRNPGGKAAGKGAPGTGASSGAAGPGKGAAEVFNGECHHCKVFAPAKAWGHRISQCPLKTAAMQAERAAGGAAGGNGGNKGWSKGGGKAGGGGGWRSQGGKATGKGLHAAWIDDPYCPPVSPTGQSSWWGGGALACLTESTPAPMTVPTRSVSWADEKFVHANSFACLEEAVEELNQAYDRLEIMYEDDIKSWDELQKTTAQTGLLYDAFHAASTADGETLMYDAFHAASSAIRESPVTSLSVAPCVEHVSVVVLPHTEETGIVETRNVEASADTDRASQSGAWRPVGGRRARWAARRLERLKMSLEPDDSSVDQREPHEYAYRSEKLEECGIDDVAKLESDREFNLMIFGPHLDGPKRAPPSDSQHRWFDRDSSLSPLFQDERAPVVRGGANDPILAMVAWRSEHDDNWVRIECVADSGAAAPVAPPSMAPGVPTRESEGSREGRNFTTATGAPLKNLGEQELHAVTDNGLDTTVLFQLADVSRPLMSVSAICDKGNRVIFGKSGGVIQSLATGQEIPFERQGGVYALGIWIRGPSGPSPVAAAAKVVTTSGFTRS